MWNISTCILHYVFSTCFRRRKQITCLKFSLYCSFMKPSLFTSETIIKTCSRWRHIVIIPRIVIFTLTCLVFECACFFFSLPLSLSLYYLPSLSLSLSLSLSSSVCFNFSSHLSLPISLFLISLSPCLSPYLSCSLYLEIECHIYILDEMNFWTSI